jgi:phosphonopyruvate decarboxylase
MIKMSDALRIIDERRGDAVVVPTMTAIGTWQATTQNESLDMPLNGAMGKAASFALGVCLARPDKKVVVVDGDGSLLMNLGALVTIAGKSPENLYHFVNDNGVYGVTGGQPVPNQNGHSFADMATGAGYAAAYEFDDLEEFATSIDEIMNSKGPVMIAIKAEPIVETLPLSERPRRRRTPQAIKELAETLR